MGPPEPPDRVVARLAAGAQGPPLLEGEVLVRAARIARDAINRGENASQITMAVVRALTDERLGYQRMVRLADIAHALGMEVPAGTIDQVTERGREEARQRTQRGRPREALERADDLIDRDVLESDEAWEHGGPDELER